MVTGLVAAVALLQAGVGEVSFPNSGNTAAQAPFLTGLAQLHNFEYTDAAKWFRQAQAADPGFALAYWGEAMTYNHPVWMEQDIAAARRVLKRLGETADVRERKAESDREKAYLRTVEILYGDGDKFARDEAYADAMADLHRAYPDDVEATAFFALALLGTAHQGRDFGVYMRAAALLEPLFPTHPRHPGIAHYLIHSYDDPVHAPLGLRAARAYSTIAPAAAHAQHMCSHIFVATGMWDDVVEANETAVRLTMQDAATRPLLSCTHYRQWLIYGYLQQGRVAESRRMLLACRDAARAAGRFNELATIRARYLFDSGEWTGEIASMAIPPGQPAATVTYELTNALGALMHGDLDAAAAAASRFDAASRALRDGLARSRETNPDGYPLAEVLARLDILHKQIAAMTLVSNGHADDGLVLLRTAAVDEEKLPYEFGPPFIDKPTYELLGEALLRVHKPGDARLAFERALARTPGRTAALAGLMTAAEQSGDAKKAAAARAQLNAIWHRADHPPSRQ